ncbi:hypothetical protein [Hoeflea sp.]|uniref:hypothetical protein n=1 Tax=Hoeflea sp. TaxID=1940281 RepID=UPI003B521675
MLSPPTDFRVAQSRKMKRGEQIFRRAMDELSGREETALDGRISYLCGSSNWPTTQRIINRTERRLSALYDSPIPPKALEKILHITPKERREWTKDGRLPAMDKQTSNRASNRFSVSVYSPVKVAKLHNNPEIIADWRRHDNELDKRLGFKAES